MSRVTSRKLLSAAARARIQADFFGILVGTAPACWSCVGAPSTSYEPRSPAQGAALSTDWYLFRVMRSDVSKLRRPPDAHPNAHSPRVGGPGMAERAAHLLDRVFPDVPIRQWVLSLSYRLRYQLAWNHDVCRGVVAVFVRSVLGFLRARARDEGVVHSRGGAVAVIQRFGGALNLNVHVHVLALDGVFARDPADALNFHPSPRLTALDVAEVLATVEPRITRLLDRRGLGQGDDDGSASDAWADEAPVLAGLAAASVQGTVAMGPNRGARLCRLGDPPDESEAPPHDGCHARANGFDLHAGLVVSRAGVEWVLSLPHRLRYQLAWDHDLCRAVVAVFLRAVLDFLRARARGGGVADGRGGAVAVIQPFGGALNLERFSQRCSDSVAAVADVVDAFGGMNESSGGDEGADLVERARPRWPAPGVGAACA